MPSRPPPSRSQSRASSIASADTTSSQHAAFLGANLAFLGQSAPRPNPIHATYTGNSTISQRSGDYGASAGAAQARSSSLTRAPVHSPRPGSFGLSDSRGDAMHEQERNSNKDRKMIQLAPPSQQARPAPSKSPSQQAAMIAAARAPQPSQPSAEPQRGSTRAGLGPRQPPVAPKPRGLSGNVAKSRSRVNEEKPTDETPIPPTTSLVDLFEQKMQASESSEKRPQPITITSGSDLPLKSPKPVRSGGITSMLKMQLEEAKSQDDTQVPNTEEVIQPSRRYTRDMLSSDDSFASAIETLGLGSPPAISTPGPTGLVSQDTSLWPGPALKVGNEAKRQPATSLSPLRPDTSGPIDIRPPRRTGTAQSDVLSISSSQSLKTIAAQYNQAYPRRMTPLTTGDELANAIVASSLASSRGPSPLKEAPPVPTRRKKGHHHHKLGLSRTSSPVKTGMLKTLRKPQDEDSSSEDDDDSVNHPYGHHRKKRLIRKHPNKHHEGDRKRWRDAVTDRERKRYEGVWAANKGLHYSFTREEEEFFRRAPKHPRTQETRLAANEQVSNIVARDIWNRSRLPEFVLETVWDLVDTDSVGRLSKEEFVVGMWLIDQRLKGRKLPVRVTDSVWASVRGIQGIKVKVKK